MSVRLLLGFALVALAAPAAHGMPPGGGGSGGGHDGYGQPLPDPKLPLGVMTVKVVMGGNMASPRVGAAVELVSGNAVKATITTGKDGRARFEGLSPGARYQARVKGVSWSGARSAVVSMPSEGGVRLLLSSPPTGVASQPTKASTAAAKPAETLPKTRDSSVLSLGAGTRLLGQVNDGSVEFLQVLVLRNASREVFDPGEGLRFALPEGAGHAALGQAGAGKLRVAEDRKSVMLVTPVPPGRLEVSYTYKIHVTGERMDFRQIMPVRQRMGLFAIMNNANVVLEGPAMLGKELRGQPGGEKVLLYTLRPVTAGGALEFALSGLPFRDPTLRNSVLALTVALFLWGAFGVAAGGRRARAKRSERDRLLDELAAVLAREGGAPERVARERGKLLEKLRATWER